MNLLDRITQGISISISEVVVPPHGRTNLVKAFIINYLKQLIFQKAVPKAVPKAVHKQTKTLYKYSTSRSESGKRTYSIAPKRMISGLVLKYLNGECFVICRCYKYSPARLKLVLSDSASRLVLKKRNRECSVIHEQHKCTLPT